MYKHSLGTTVLQYYGHAEHTVSITYTLTHTHTCPHSHTHTCPHSHTYILTHSYAHTQIHTLYATPLLSPLFLSASTFFLFIVSAGLWGIVTTRGRFSGTPFTRLNISWGRERRVGKEGGRERGVGKEGGRKDRGEREGGKKEEFEVVRGAKTECERSEDRVVQQEEGGDLLGPFMSCCQGSCPCCWLHWHGLQKTEWDKRQVTLGLMTWKLFQNVSGTRETNQTRSGIHSIFIQFLCYLQ